MSTWNHRIRLATKDEREVRRQHGDLCTVTARCAFPVEYFTGYDLITGLAGRTGKREIGACFFHANQFAAKHGLTMPSGETR